ncbi:MAG: hypothetical protein HZC29_06290, partial [Thaumarchaeota archaeon]|nr:hypothetical protein [Nitrososphaerota archaeon]
MRLKNRFLVASLVFATSSYFYGNYRFNSTRYEPQCDHLPGVCFYGSVQPTSSEFKLEQHPTKDIWRTKLCFGSNCQEIDISYDKYQLVPNQIYGNNPDNCSSSGSKQIIFSSTKRWMVKGCTQDRSFGKAYEGIREMILPSEMLNAQCNQSIEFPWCFADSTDYCKSIYQLYILTKSNKRDACTIMAVMERAKIRPVDKLLLSNPA